MARSLLEAWLVGALDDRVAGAELGDLDAADAVAGVDLPPLAASQVLDPSVDRTQTAQRVLVDIRQRRGPVAEVPLVDLRTHHQSDRRGDRLLPDQGHPGIENQQ